ncbi:helix-turn-helix domain-containing protein [Streptomyces phage Alderaan]|nr:helix-turn-helix domain-containing protein [Streptomyces phage Alderaan]
MQFNVTIEVDPTAPQYDVYDEPTAVQLIRQAHAQGFTITADARNYTITLTNEQRTVRVIPAARPQLPTDRQRDEMHRMIVLGRELTWGRSGRNVGVLTDGSLKMSHQLSDGLLARGYVTGTGHTGSEARRTLVACLAFARTAKHESWEARDEILRRAILDIAQTDTVAWRETVDPADEPEQQAAEVADEPVEDPTPQPDEPAEVEEQTEATYTRRRAHSGAPTTLLGQEAAVEGALAAGGFLPADNPKVAEFNRRRAARFVEEQSAGSSVLQRMSDELNRRGEPVVGQPSRRLMADMLDLFGRYEREAAAERARHGDSNPYDLDPFEEVENIADEWASTEGDEQARAAFLDRLADQLTLDNLRVIRAAAEAAAAVTPRVVRAERARYKAPEIARRAGLTDGRVYQILRDK